MESVIDYKTTESEEVKEKAESDRKNSDSDIERICRGYAFVELRDTPYDSSLGELQKRIESSYNNSLSSYDEDKNRLIKIIEELERMPSDSGKSFFNIGRMRSIFRDNKDKRSLEEISEFVIKNKDKLQEMQKITEEAYNRNSRVVLEVSSGIKGIESIVTKLEDECNKIGVRITSYHELSQNPEKLRIYVTGLVENRIKDGNLKEIEDEDKKFKYVEGVMKKGREELQRLCENYLKIKNDIPIARNLLSYKSLVEKFNEISDSFIAARENIMEDISQVQEVIKLYEVITKKELGFLQDIRLPEKYRQAVYELVSGMEKVDGEFSQKVLEAVFSEGTKIVKPNFNGVVSGLIKHVNGNGNGNGNGSDNGEVDGGNKNGDK